MSYVMTCPNCQQEQHPPNDNCRSDLCSFCRATSDPRVPCPRGRGYHFEGIEIHNGPDRGGLYTYTLYWWRKDSRRQQFEIFHAGPARMEAWSEALEAYRETKRDASALCACGHRYSAHMVEQVLDQEGCIVDDFCSEACTCQSFRRAA